MKTSVICLLFYSMGLVSPKVSIPVHIQSAGAPHFLVMDLDHNPPPIIVPNLPDKDIKAIKMDISFRGAPGGTVTYSFYKCGLMIFNSTTSAESEYAFTFENEWIDLFLNGTNECVTNGRRELVIFVESTVPLDGSFSFEKQQVPDYFDKISFLTIVNVHFDGKVRKMVPLDGILKIQDEFSKHFPINISCNTELTFEIGVCNCTFLRIEETGPFNRPFTDTEKRILNLMKSVRCDTWKNDVHESNYFMRSLSGAGNLKIETNLREAANLLKDDILLAELIKI